jgi:hypothetical protein
MKIALKFISSDLSYVVTVKSTVEILHNFVAFSEYMYFTALCERPKKSVDYLYFIRHSMATANLNKNEEVRGFKFLKI